MGTPERPSFAEFIASKAIQENSASVSKGAITITTLVALFVMFFRDWGFGIWWVFVVPALWFVVSLVIAMPFQILRLRWAHINWSNPKRARLGTALLDSTMYIALVPVTFFGLRTLAIAIYG